MTDASDTCTAAVLMAVYRNDDPSALQIALGAVDTEQTRAPDLLFVVLDGPVPEPLRAALMAYKTNTTTDMEILELPENRGLSSALRAGVEALRKRGMDYVIRTDADDISRPSRNAEQIDYMQANPTVGLASSQVVIFENSPDTPTGRRNLPIDGSITQFAQSRTPMNHSATILRMAALQELNYPETRLPFEDWWISLRILKAGWDIGVIDAEHLDFRGGADMISRRRGWAYARQEIEYFRLIHTEGLLSTGRVVKNLATRLTLRMLPPGLMKQIYALKMHR